MNNIEFYFQHLCDYYNVTIQEAIELSTRKTGRKPNLPGSETCDAVSGMNLEEIWDLEASNTKRDWGKLLHLVLSSRPTYLLLCGSL